MLANAVRLYEAHIEQLKGQDWSDYGVALHYIGRHAEAADALSTGLDQGVLSPAESYRLLGASLRSEGNDDDALEAYKEAFRYTHNQGETGAVKVLFEFGS